MIVHTLLLSSSVLAALPSILFSTSPASAQPDMARPAPETIADRGSALYRFADLRLTAPEGRTPYRLRVAIPKRAPGRAGYAVAWLLDGKAALAHVDEALLTELDKASPPVIVAIGHDTALRLDGASRMRDYTPGPVAQEARRLRGGGADAFLRRILVRFTPRVAALAPIDRTRQTLWGHSLGGLFVLHAMMTRPDAFRAGYAADPSLWWTDRAILATPLTPGAERSRRLVVAEAGAVPDPARRGSPDRRFPTEAERAAFYRRLEGGGIRVCRNTLPGLSHGETLGATVAPALRLAARIAP